MSKRSSSNATRDQFDAKRVKLSGQTSTLPPRNSFRGLPLELRDQIYANVFDNLTAGPQHPYSEFPLNSRFEDYISLLQVDKATSDEAKTVFTKRYAGRIVFYFEDACSLFDLHRRWEESESFSWDTRFVLRTRSDLDPRMELDDGIQWMNEVFFCNPFHGVDEDDDGMIGLTGFTLNGRKVLNMNGMPLGPRFTITDSDHSQCRGKERCIPYKRVGFPPLKNSLRAEAAVWKMETSRRWNAELQHMSKKTEDVSVHLFSGKLNDISFNDFPVRDAKVRLISILREWTWPKFLARYDGRYPIDEEEYQDFMYGNVQYDWPLSDLDEEYDNSTEEDSEVDVEDDDHNEEEEDEDDDDDDDDDSAASLPSDIFDGI